MEPFKGIKLEILCEGRSLTLYEDPDKDQKEKNEFAKLYYVEAVAGARFVPRVTLDSSYSLSRLQDHERVYIGLSPDGAHELGGTISKLDIKRLRGERKPVTKDFHKFTHLDSASGKWIRGHLSFSALAIREDDGTRRDQAQLQSAARLGSILIRVSHVVGQSIRNPAPSSSAYSLTPNKQVSEKLIKGKSITNSISLDDAKSDDITHISTWHHTHGPAKFCLDVKILYRSKEALQSLGCISRVPSPETDLREENQILRARLAKIERDGKSNVKEENSRSQARRVVKHELDDEGEGFLPPPTRRRVGTIDLTDDGGVDIVNLTDD